jgi:hypothetical protein
MNSPHDPQLQQALDIGPAAPDTRHAAVRETPATSVLAPPISCVECRRPWLREAERWRLKLLLEDGEDAELVPYCPACHRREFES